ncbi:UV radiation resistance protein and autophagy-related subunit 14-domain-containing protein [Rhodofomes roseus]|uniref:Autophagy-related protein 14 n=1 Tax=Rhodofomes roseus TaxID=34475 RepID=A0ABQ8K0Z9_9APHY|nr:UV radiation resistance protein and autophagy-related subunit 14-domain-containing protein [Rhodofomes roseus]KAH9830106.1 UV radiation resistance protein and autophagy-related subunit 14-domain-containing protein [Rhodofomes roseus]
MECQNCELKQRQFYCENCLKQHLLSLRVQTKHAAADRDNHIASAQKALESIVDPARLRRADLKGGEERVQEIWAAVDEARKANDKTRERLRTTRASLSTRRRTLAIASSTFHNSTGAYYPSSTPSSASASPPGHSPTPPGSFPHAASPLASLPQAIRPTTHRRGSSSYSASPLSSTPPAGASMSRAPTAQRVASSPQAVRGVLISPPTASAPYARGAHERGADMLARQIDETNHQLAALGDTIARARAGLVQELVEVFSVVEVGGRPPIGGKAGTKGEWTIGGLVLPVPGDMRRYPPDHINAVITHTVHFLTLLAFYLGVRLPFELVWSQSTPPPPVGASKGMGLLGVGVPWIGAVKGAENGGWARWSTKYPLHVSSSSPPSASSASGSSPSSTSASSSRPTSRRASTTISTPPNSSTGRARSGSLSASMADSQIEADVAEPAAPGGAFTTALAMLVYDVCYLAHTQAVEVPLAQAGEVLGNLWAVCCSPELGRKSHATRPLLAPPTPPSFPLDFAQLLQATAANPTRPKARGTGGRERRTERIVEEEEDGWDFVEASME